MNIDDFWNASVGTWEIIEEIPDNFTQFANSKDSQYYTNEKEDTIIRVSNHWGSGIRECNWYLKGFKRNNSFLFSKWNNNKEFIGIIKISDLIDVQQLEYA